MIFLSSDLITAIHFGDTNDALNVKKLKAKKNDCSESFDHFH